MKIKYSLLTLFFLSGICAAQSSISATMGLSMVAMPKLHDYVLNITQQDNQINTFESAIQFSASYYFRYTNKLDMGLNIDYELDSYSFDGGMGGLYELSYNILKPSVSVFSVFPGEGYQFRLGGGIGPRFLFMSEKQMGFSNHSNGNSMGVGVFAAADAATMLSSVSYAYIGANLQYDYIGAPELNGRKLRNTMTNEFVEFNNFSAGIKIGVVFFL